MRRTMDSARKLEVGDLANRTIRLGEDVEREVRVVLEVEVNSTRNRDVLIKSNVSKSASRGHAVLEDAVGDDDESLQPALMLLI